MAFSSMVRTLYSECDEKPLEGLVQGQQLICFMFLKDHSGCCAKDRLELVKWKRGEYLEAVPLM